MLSGSYCLLCYSVTESHLLVEALSTILNDYFFRLVDAHALALEADSYVVELINEARAKGGDAPCEPILLETLEFLLCPLT